MFLRGDVRNEEAQLFSRLQLLGGSTENWHQQRQTPGALCLEGGCLLHPRGQRILDSRTKGLMASWCVYVSPEINPGCPEINPGSQFSLSPQLCPGWLNPDCAWKQPRSPGVLCTRRERSAAQGPVIYSQAKLFVSSLLSSGFPGYPGYLLRSWKEDRMLGLPREQLG